MSLNAVSEVKNDILHALAEVKDEGVLLSNKDLSDVLDVPVFQINRAVNSLIQERAPMIELAKPEEGDGYRFIGNVANLPSLDGESVDDEESGVAEEQSDDETDFDLSIIASLAKLFAKKKVIPESAALAQLNVDKDSFELALTFLESEDALSVEHVEDFGERALRKTDLTLEYVDFDKEVQDANVALVDEQKEQLNEEPQEAPQEEEQAEASEDEGVIMESPIKSTTRRTTASDDVIPILDEMILKHVAEKGSVSDSGAGRDLNGEIEGYGKVGRPRIMKRVNELAEEGKLETFPVGKNRIKYRIPGTDGLSGKAKEAKESKSVKKSPAKPVKAKVAKTSSKPVEKPVSESSDNNVVQYKSSEEVVEVIHSSEIVSGLKDMLESSSLQEGPLKVAFEGIINHIEAQDKEIAKWRAIGKSLMKQINEI